MIVMPSCKFILQIIVALSLLMQFESSGLASDDMLIFTGYTNRIYGNLTFNNGWNEYGWGPRFVTNNPVHTDALAYCLAPNGGWQAISLTHGDIDSALYTNLTFWINGGAGGGQTVGVGGMLGGVEQPRVGIGINGKLPTNSWLQVSLSLAALGCANQSNFDGIRIWSNSGNVQSNFFIDDVVLCAAPPPALVHLAVNAAQSVRTVDPRVFAVNTAAWDGNLDTTNTLSVLTNLGNQALRWPGGSWSDDYHWTNEPNSVGYVNRNWGAFSTNFIHVATNSHAQAFIIVNYGSSTPDEAAWGVRMFNITNHCGFKYWEVGNENYGSWETDNNTNAPWLRHDPWTYAMRFTNYYVRMKAVDPAIRIGAVVVSSESGNSNNATHFAVNPRTGVTNYGWTPVVLSTLKSLGVTPDFLIDHEYCPDVGDTSTLLWSQNWTSIAANLRQMLNDYMGPVSSNVELNVTENGNSGNDRQRSSLVSGLFYADSIGQILQTEINTRLWWDMRNGQNAITNSDPAYYGWRTNAGGYYYSDEGIVYNNAEPTNCYPTYYCAKLMKYFAGGGDTVVQASSSYPLLAVYAVKRTNGILTLLVINKSPSSNLTAAVNLAGYLPMTNALVYSYGISQDLAAGTPVGSPDLTQSNFTRAGVVFTNIFPPYSATVMVLTTLVSTNANLASLVINPGGTLTPAFVSNVLNYATTEAYGTRPTVTVVNSDLMAINRLIYNATTNLLASGVASGALTLSPNPAVTNLMRVQVTAPDGVTIKNYVVSVKQLPSQTMPMLTNSLNGGVLTLTWPLDHLGYRLQVQTNQLSLGLSTNWFTWPNSTNVNTLLVPIDLGIPGMFFWLVYP